MIKKTITYTDWDGNQQTTELYFNISKVELGDNLDLIETLRPLQKALEAEAEVSSKTVMEIFELIKRFVKIGYGVRVGQQFRKDSESWENFRWSAAYDPFVFGLIEKPEEGMQFLIDMIPQDLISEAEKTVGQEKLPFNQEPSEEVTKPTESVETKNVFEQNQPQGPTSAEVASMSDAELREYVRKNLS